MADKIKACPDAKIAVKGYTDNSGNDAINQPLSENGRNQLRTSWFPRASPLAP